MTEYPILVEQFTGRQAMTIVCEKCHADEVIKDDELLNDGFYACPRGCGGSATYKYDEGDKCPNCGALGFWSQTHGALGGCCSRVCQLQAEYAAELAAKKGAA